MKVIYLLALFIFTLFGANITPIASVNVGAPVLDLAFDGAELYAVTSNGDLFLAYPNKPRKMFTLPKISTPYGDFINQKALSLDISSSKKIALAGQDGYLYVAQDKTLNKTAFYTPSVIRKIAFIDEDKILLCLIDGQVALFDTKLNKTIYKVQVSSSSLNDMALSEDKKTAVLVGESGYVYMFDILSGKLKAVYKNVNLDAIFKVDYKNSFIITAGQDKKAVLLKENGQIVAKFNADFLVYAVGLSPDALKVALSCDEQSNICVYDTVLKSQIAIVKGHNATLNKILFLNKTKFASAGDENKILIWEIK